MIPSEQKLLKLLSNNDVTFFIPPYQRNYEWTFDQCNVFLEDIKKTYNANINGSKVEHFFGTITYFSDETPFGQPNKLVLIDGQQRITTTMLFLVALRDTCQDEGVIKFINNKYLKNENATDDQNEYKIKLKQVETDWESYKNIILNEPLTNAQKDSAVYKNYQWFKMQLESMVQEGFDLNELISQGIDKFSVVTVELQPEKNIWENPQEIFESMNSLGKLLSLADLVRNYLLLGKTADTQTKYYNKYWLKIEKTIPKQVSNFIRDYMQAYLGKNCLKATDANHKALYAQFKSIFSTEEAEDLLKRLASDAELYSYIINDESCGDKKIDRYLSDFKILNLTTANSFLLSLLRYWKDDKFTSSDMAEILDAFEIYCCRRRFILGLTSAENKNFPLLVNYLDMLTSAKDKKLKMFEILSNQESALRLPNDNELMRVLENLNFYNFKYSKFYLALVEEKITKSRPDLTDDKLQKEHIMPQKLNDTWKEELGPNYEEIHQELVDTIGNITLIRHNQELGNKPFEEKKKIYINNAGLQIAKTMIVDKEQWNDVSIKERTKWLSKYIMDNVFPIPDSMRKTNNYKTKDKVGLSFLDLQLIGEDIHFFKDPSITAKVISDTEVEFEGKIWKLSPLTREIYTRKGMVNNSGAYQGAWHWAYDGVRLGEIMY